MSKAEFIKLVPDRGLANTLSCIEMPYDYGVSDRTNGSRGVGGFHMLVHLVQGEWDPGSRVEMTEFLGRVVTNAARQGITIERE